MIAGISLLGFSCAFIFAPLLPEIIDAVQDKEEIGENQELNDKASGLFNSSFAIGCLLGPIIGGLLNDNFGYRTTCDIMAFFSLIYSFIYFSIVILPYLLQRYR